ncbi:N-acetylglucosamine-6-phosphate deacetylase [Aquibacillus salsiterrae]|uniref:N-acetylglucosamine-6-phosphate deacetylase n=1 Tax=Aquibacillus salsiterrae TaxID=2950439 RepID=A0A9X4AG07_9BACI|nr:N-acetylglucosamine-6-phosphate deacetylase [Aquibacillus salsiterrae]MDC3418567.1 N-acetylglucosamine-6-phosphate deacetylase [Aquibacillus salsiterrae]
MGTVIINNATIYTEAGVLLKGFIKINNGKITDVGAGEEIANQTEVGNGHPSQEVIDLPAGYKMVPGMIDVHIHGANGADTMDATPEALATIAAALPREGTTSFLATTITQEVAAIETALQTAGNFITNQASSGAAEVIGIHLEGPFINEKRAGAQPLAHIIDPNVALFQKWQEIARNQIKMVTLAPEQPGGIELTRYLKETGVVASIGHSDATLAQVDDAIAQGLTHVTHLYNQMREFHHREPGVVGAALLRDDLVVEIIADGVHSRRESVQLAFRQKTADRLQLITDAMRAKCLKNGTYDLGGQEVTVKGNKAYLPDGTLAGSVLEMGHAFRNMIKFSGCQVEDAIKMSSTNAAKELGIFDRKGSIAVGKDADLVILDEDNDVYMTFCRGKLAYKRGD